MIWSSDDGCLVDASELSGDEGRGKLRKARGRSTHPEIPGWPNGVTRRVRTRHPTTEFIGGGGDTRGTEPSHVPWEKKSREIP